MRKIIQKIGCVVVGVALCAMTAYAGMDSIDYSVSVNGITTGATNSQTYVVRGVIESIYVDVTALTTNTVTITSDQGTIFSKSGITADTQFFPRVAGQTTGGAALTYVSAASLDTNTVTAASGGIGGCQKIAVAGNVKVTVIGQTSSSTNTVVTTLLVNK